MATNDFVPFGTGVGANVLTQANYLTSGYATGFTAGSVAASAQVGKALRQGTFVAAGIGQFIINQLNINVVDDGNVANFATNFKNAILASIPTSGVVSFNGRGGAVTLTSGDVLTALGGTPILVGGTAVGDLTGSWPGPTIKSGAVTNAKMANMGALTVKGNNTGSPATPQDINISDLLTALGFDFSGMGPSGIIRGPNGFKLQWGPIPITDDSLTTVNLPVAYTSWYRAWSTLRYNGLRTGGQGGGTYVWENTLSQLLVFLAWDGDSTGLSQAAWFTFGV